jgi:hypothetical protein
MSYIRRSDPPRAGDQRGQAWTSSACGGEDAPGRAQSSPLGRPAALCLFFFLLLKEMRRRSARASPFPLVKTRRRPNRQPLWVTGTPFYRATRRPQTTAETACPRLVLLTTGQRPIPCSPLSVLSQTRAQGHRAPRRQPRSYSPHQQPPCRPGSQSRTRARSVARFPSSPPSAAGGRASPCARPLVLRSSRPPKN